MACEHPRGCFWLHLLHLPQSNLHVEASTGEQASIGTPGQRIHRAAMASERLQVRAQLRVPEPNGRIISAAGERASIGGKGQAFNAVGRPIRAEPGPALHVPPLDGTIPAPAGERASIWAESEGIDIVGMRLPCPVRGW